MTDYTYLDLDVDLLPNTFTDDISVKKDLRAIRQSVTNLLLTRPGERFFSLAPAGAGLQDLFFELKNLSISNNVFIRENIKEIINKYEPRVVFNDLIIKNDDTIADGSGIDVQVIYDIVSFGSDVDSLETSTITDSITITIEGPSNG